MCLGWDLHVQGCHHIRVGICTYNSRWPGLVLVLIANLGVRRGKLTQEVPRRDRNECGLDAEDARGTGLLQQFDVKWCLAMKCSSKKLTIAGSL